MFLLDICFTLDLRRALVSGTLYQFMFFIRLILISLCLLRFLLKFVILCSHYCSDLLCNWNLSHSFHIRGFFSILQFLYQPLWLCDRCNYGTCFLRVLICQSCLVCSSCLSMIFLNTQFHFGGFIISVYGWS